MPTRKQVKTFCDGMDRDLKQMRDEFEAECQLADAVKKYEKISGNKVKLTYIYPDD